MKTSTQVRTAILNRAYDFGFKAYTAGILSMVMDDGFMGMKTTTAEDALTSKYWTRGWEAAKTSDPWAEQEEVDEEEGEEI